MFMAYYEIVFDLLEEKNYFIITYFNILVQIVCKNLVYHNKYIYVKTKFNNNILWKINVII